MKAATWIYLFSYGKFVAWTTLFTCFVGSTWRFCFPVRYSWRGRHQSPGWWSLHPFRILFPFIFMLTVCSSKMDLNPASNILQLRWESCLRGLGVNLLLLFYLKTGEMLVYTLCLMVVCCCMLMRQKIVNSFVLIFMGIFWSDVCDRCSCICKSSFYCTICCLGVEDIVDIIRHWYNIILIVIR